MNGGPNPPAPPDPTPAPAEAERLAALRDLVVLDSEPEPLFDQLAQMASRLCGTPVALLSLVDAERQWFKAQVGLPGVNETPRDVSFCAHAIRSTAVFVVPDASADPRFAANPLVTGDPGIRFYAGAPVVLTDGARVGTLCVIDREPRSLAAPQLQLLQELAQLASQALAMRRDLITRTLAVRGSYQQALADSEARYRAIVEEQDELVSLADADGVLLYVNGAYARHFGRSAAQLVGTSLYDYIEPADRAGVRQRMAETLTSSQPAHSENRMLAADGRELWVAWTNQLQRDAQGRPLLHSVGRDVSARRQAEIGLRATQAFLNRTGRLAGVGGWELELPGQVLRWSEETRRIHGVGADHVPTVDSAIGFYAPAARPVIEAAVQRGLQAGEGWDLELPFVNAQGRPMWVRAVGEVEFDQGRPRRLVGALQDITERVAVQGTLLAVIEALPAVVSVMETDGRFRLVNSAFERWVGRPRSEVVGRTGDEVVGAAAVARAAPWVGRVLAGETVSFEFDDTPLPGSGGAARHQVVNLIPLRGQGGRVDGYLSVMQDVTHHKQEAVRLLQLAQRDPLTGLLNRRGVVDHFASLLAAGEGQRLALLCLDLDHFKPVNDQHGHLVGDQVLQILAQRLLKLVRPTDAVARLGGDEFALLLPGVREDAHARVVADKVIQAAAVPVQLDGLSVQVGASVGLAFGVVVGVAAETAWAEMLARADSRLYEAKASGRGRQVSER